MKIIGSQITQIIHEYLYTTNLTRIISLFITPPHLLYSLVIYSLVVQGKPRLPNSDLKCVQ